MKELLEKYEEIIYSNEKEFLQEFLEDHHIAWDDLVAVYFGSCYTEVKFLISSGETCADYIKTDALLKWCERYEHTHPWRFCEHINP